MLHSSSSLCTWRILFVLVNRYAAAAAVVTLWFSCSWMTGCTVGNTTRRTIGRSCSSRRKGCTGLKKVLVEDGLWRPGDAGGTVLLLICRGVHRKTPASINMNFRDGHVFHLHWRSHRGG